MSTRDHNNCTYNNFKPTSHVPTIELEVEHAEAACDRLSLDVSWNHRKKKTKLLNGTGRSESRPEHDGGLLD